MNCATSGAIYLAVLLFNFLLLHFISKRNGDLNPIGLLSCFLFFIGTLILLIITLEQHLSKFYKRK